MRIAQNTILELVLKADRGSKVKPRLIDTALLIDNPKHDPTEPDLAKTKKVLKNHEEKIVFVCNKW